MTTDSQDIIEVVFKRADILRLVCEECPKKQALVEAVSKSRPTVDRAIRELESYHLVQRDNGACKPTFTGEMAYQLYSKLEDSFGSLEAMKAELSSLPRDADLDEVVFHGASVFQPPDHAPYEKIQPMYEDFSSCDSIVGVTRVVLPPYINQILACGAREVADVELVVTDQVLNILLETQRDLMVDCIESEASVYKVDGLSRYSLFLVDGDTLYVTVYSDSNHLSAVIRNTDSRAIDWAASKISNIKGNADRLTDSSVQEPAVEDTTSV